MAAAVAAAAAPETLPASCRAGATVANVRQWFGSQKLQLRQRPASAAHAAQQLAGFAPVSERRWCCGLDRAVSFSQLAGLPHCGAAAAVCASFPTAQRAASAACSVRILSRETPFWDLTTSPVAREPASQQHSVPARQGASLALLVSLSPL